MNDPNKNSTTTVFTEKSCTEKQRASKNTVKQNTSIFVKVDFKRFVLAVCIFLSLFFFM